jgi:hypothetical protein
MEIQTLCNICDKSYKYIKKYSFCEATGLKELEIITAHATCRSKVNKVKTLYHKLTEAQFELFCLKHSLAIIEPKV